MVTKRVKVSQLESEINMLLKDYTDEVSLAINKEVEKTAKKIQDDIKAASPVRTGEYKKGWARKKSAKGGTLEYTIHQKNRPHIAHLLEFGHAIRRGGRVRAIPHMRPAYDKHVPAMEKRIEQIIKDGG